MQTHTWKNTTEKTSIWCPLGHTRHLTYLSHTASESCHKSRVFHLRFRLTFPHREINHKESKDKWGQGDKSLGSSRQARACQYTQASPPGPDITVPISPQGTGPCSLYGTHLWVLPNFLISWATRLKKETLRSHLLNEHLKFLLI